MVRFLQIFQGIHYKFNSNFRFSIAAVDTKIEISPSGPGSVDAARPQKVAWFPLREAKFPYRDIGSPGRTRTSDKLINSQPLYQLSYRGTALNGSGF